MFLKYLLRKLVRPANNLISLKICAVWSELSLSTWLTPKNVFRDVLLSWAGRSHSSVTGHTRRQIFPCSGSSHTHINDRVDDHKGHFGRVAKKKYAFGMRSYQWQLRHGSAFSIRLVSSKPAELFSWNLDNPKITAWAGNPRSRAFVEHTSQKTCSWRGHMLFNLSEKSLYQVMLVLVATIIVHYHYRKFTEGWKVVSRLRD